MSKGSASAAQWVKCVTALASACVFGCSTDASPKPGPDAAAATTCFLGDSGAPATLELFYVNGAGETVPVVSGDHVPLVEAPQGGWGMYVIPHVRNMDTCGVTLSTAMIDVCSTAVVSVELRSVILQNDGTGVAVPVNLDSEGLVDACPHAYLTRSVDRAPYLIDVIAQDPEGRQAEAKVEVVPTCSDSYCSCQCDQTYVYGTSVCPLAAAMGANDSDVGADPGCPASTR